MLSPDPDKDSHRESDQRHGQEHERREGVERVGPGIYHANLVALAAILIAGPATRQASTPPNRGIRTANVPLVPGIAIPHQLKTLKKPLVVSLHATPERLIQVRQNRLLSIGVGPGNDDYIDRQSVTEEVTFARRLSVKYNWALLDVTRRSIEETAAAVLKLFADRQRQRLAE